MSNELDAIVMLATALGYDVAWPELMMHRFTTSDENTKTVVRVDHFDDEITRVSVYQWVNEDGHMVPDSAYEEGTTLADAVVALTENA